MHLLSHLAGALGEVAKQAVDFRCGVGGALGQGPHFVRHHRKTATLFTGPCGLDGSVQRQQVGLFGD
ncbi:hypothetical protein D3C84_965680 [compost metagenome]